MQQKARGFARFRHLQRLLPRERSASSIVQEVVARGRVGETGDKGVNGEQKLGLRIEIMICFRAYVGGTVGVCGDGLRTGLYMRA